MRLFQVEGCCNPQYHYMIDVKARVNQITTELIKQRKYFVINRARQYGKTTILNALYHSLQEDYIVFFISFEELGTSSYESEARFCSSFLRLLADAIEFEDMKGVADSVLSEIKTTIDAEYIDFLMISGLISRMCMSALKPIVLMIDEVDSASNNQVFVDFLAMIRNKYLQRDRRPTFQSVILAGVYNIKNLQLKIRPGDEHKYNSPWNIAADFNIDMSFQIDEIATMLAVYGQEHNIVFDYTAISQLIYDYTSGYPYLVSRICKLIDEQSGDFCTFPTLADAWTKQGLLEAVKNLLKESNTLFDDMIKKVIDYPELRKLIQDILFRGSRYSYETDNASINLGVMFGILKNKQNIVAISNRIFETKLYNFFISEEEVSNKM